MARLKTLYSLPNLLTYFRFAAIPVITLLFFFDTPLAVWTNVVLFAIAGLTDYLDGVVARATNQTTILGKFLDASTDKMLVGVMLMLLLAFHRLDGIWIIPAIIIYLREILIAGVREFMGLYNVSVPISMLGKWKLTLQMLSIGFLTAGSYGEMLIPYAYEIGKLLFLIATVATVLSGWDYVKKALETIEKMEEEKG